MGRDRGRRPHHGRRPRRLRRAGRRLRRQGLLCPQGDKAAWSAAADRGAVPRRRRPLRDRRGRRHHRRLDRCRRSKPCARPATRSWASSPSWIAWRAAPRRSRRPLAPRSSPARRSIRSIPIDRIAADRRRRPRVGWRRCMRRPGKATRTSFRSWRFASCWWRTTTATRSCSRSCCATPICEVEVVRARTVAGAEDALPADIACVVLDLGLPDADGLAALHRLRAAAPGVPMLVLTGLSDTARGLEAVAAGAQDYLVKGRVDGELLARSIRYAVERQRAEVVQAQLRAANLTAEENARLERGLLPRPLVSRSRGGRRQRLPAGPRARAARRRLLRRGRGGRRDAARGHRRRLRPRPRRGGARRLPADRVAHARPRRAGPSTRSSARWSKSSSTSASPTRSSPPRAWSASRRTGARRSCASRAIRCRS